MIAEKCDFFLVHLASPIEARRFGARGVGSPTIQGVRTRSRKHLVFAFDVLVFRSLSVNKGHCPQGYEKSAPHESISFSFDRLRSRGLVQTNASPNSPAPSPYQDRACHAEPCYAQVAPSPDRGLSRRQRCWQERMLRT